MSETEQKNVGTCAFCGQTAIIETVGEVTQAELDAMATDKCMCPEAKTERRKKERRAKIEAFINKRFSGNMADFVRKCIEMVESFEVDKISVNYDSKTLTIWLDSDSCLHLKIQKREDDELKV